jgi:hypothetical protein
VAVSDIKLMRPLLENTYHRLNASGHFYEVEYQTQLLQNHFIAIQYAFGSISFVPRWANPLWELAELDITRELQPLQHALRAALHATSKNFYDLPPMGVNYLENCPTVDLPWWRKVWWRLRLGAPRSLVGRADVGRVLKTRVQTQTCEEELKPVLIRCLQLLIVRKIFYCVP